MLVTPSFGFHRSVNKHNIELDVFCDWMEGSILFSNDQQISTTDVVEVLVQGHVYETQDFARQMVGNVWSELRRRQRWMGAASSFEVSGSLVKRLSTWEQNAAHGFMVALAMAKWYPDWARKFGSDYTIQGELFEQLTREALEVLFPDWVVHPTGWSKTRTVKLAEVAKDVADRLGEKIGDIQRWTRESANEQGLDILFYRSLGDGRVGVPVYLVQCASGGPDDAKLRTPDMRIWTKIVEFTCIPGKAYSMPFSLTDSEFIRICNIVNGFLLDRCRLMVAGSKKGNFVSANLESRLKSWLAPRVRTLPQLG